MTETRNIYSERPILRLIGDRGQTVTERIVNEYDYDLYVNDKLTMQFSCTPRELKELTCGYLFAKGLIARHSDIADWQLTADEIRVEIPILRSGFADKSGSEELRLTPAEILRIFDLFHDQSPIFKLTGGIHACGILTYDDVRAGTDRFLIFKEDVARRNAVEKAIGSLLLQGIPPNDLIMAFSGRLASEIVECAANYGIKFIIAAGAPSIPAVDYALAKGVTLAGFIKKEKINVYTCPERIKL